MIGQLRLSDPATPVSMPLKAALSLVATQWSQRLGYEVCVFEEPHNGGYRIGRVP